MKYKTNKEPTQEDFKQVLLHVVLDMTMRAHKKDSKKVLDRLQPVIREMMMTTECADKFHKKFVEDIKTAMESGIVFLLLF